MGSPGLEGLGHARACPNRDSVGGVQLVVARRDMVQLVQEVDPEEVDTMEAGSCWQLPALGGERFRE